MQNSLWLESLSRLYLLAYMLSAKCNGFTPELHLWTASEPWVTVVSEQMHKWLLSSFLRSKPEVRGI